LNRGDKRQVIHCVTKLGAGAECVEAPHFWRPPLVNLRPQKNLLALNLAAQHFRACGHLNHSL
jgi:hypothetical protein